MNIYDYLKWDHEHVAQLFKQFSKSDLTVRRKQIVEWIIEELEVHAKSEQATFYKALEAHPESREDALHGLKEHHEIDAQIALLKNTVHFGAEWEKSVLKLKDVVEHHVHEEEHTVFKKAKKVLSDFEAYALKEQMHDLKEQLVRKQERKHHRA